MTNKLYYSQHGEDFLLDRIFEGKRDGYFVEIGCLDGIEYSNSYYFEQQGWKGVCIEAHNGFIQALKKNRPNAQVVHCAVGQEEREQVTFYANKIGSLSTLVKSDEQRYQSNYEGSVFGHEEQKVRMRTLNSIFSEINVDRIDFISLDIEGYEEFALRGLDLRRFRPRVLLVEFKDQAHQLSITRMVEPFGYSLVGTIGCNSYYSTEKEDARVFDRSYGTVKLLHLDVNGQRRYHTAFLLRPNLLRKLQFHLRKLIFGQGKTA